MNAPRSSVFTVLVLVSKSIASAQTLEYSDRSYHEGDLHHHSTYEGSVRDAMSRQERASGAAARDRAEGYQRYISAEQTRLAIWYQAYEIRRQIEEDRLLNAARTLERRRQQKAERSAAEQAAAQALLTEFQLGVYAWPAALRRPEFESSLCVIERVLRDWDASSSLATYARSALATEAGVLRRRISRHDDIRFDQRLAAVRTLKLLQRLTTLDSSTGHSELVASLP